MKKKLKLIRCLDGDWVSRQEHHVIDQDTDTEIFDVYDLSECPEDAIIGRDLFDGDDYIRTLQLGMELAKQGYTDIDVEYEWVGYDD